MGEFSEAHNKQHLNSISNHGLSTVIVFQWISHKFNTDMNLQVYRLFMATLFEENQDLVPDHRTNQCEIKNHF